MKNLIKKIIPLLLVIVMIMGMSVMNVSADVPGIEFEYPYYYIMSANTGRYLEMPTSLYQGAPLVTNPLSVNNVYIKRWYIVSCGSNDVSIIGAVNPYNYGMSTYYLSISAYPNPQDVDFGRFTLERVTYASTSQYYSFSGTYLIKYGSEYVASDSSGYVYLTPTLGADCFWSFMNAFKGNADLFSFYYPKSTGGTFNTMGNNVDFHDTFSILGYSATAYCNESALNAYSTLKTTDIFVFVGHAAACCITFELDWDGLGIDLDDRENMEGIGGVIAAHSALANDYNTLRNVPAYSIESIPANDLSDARCVLYIGCSTAVSDSDGINLVDITYEKGAHFVLGTTADVTVGDSTIWLQQFISAIGMNYDIQSSINFANMATLSSSYTYPIYYVGDTSQYLAI